MREACADIGGLQGLESAVFIDRHIERFRHLIQLGLGQIFAGDDSTGLGYATNDAVAHNEGYANRNTLCVPIVNTIAQAANPVKWKVELFLIGFVYLDASSPGTWMENLQDNF